MASIALLVFVVAGRASRPQLVDRQTASFDELRFAGVNWMVATGVALVANSLLWNRQVPGPIVGLAAGMALLLMLGWRTIWRLDMQHLSNLSEDGRKRVLVFGAGEGGAGLISSMMNDASSSYRPVGVLDDDPRRRNRLLGGIPVSGARTDIWRWQGAADLMLIAIPSASAEQISALAGLAEDASLEVMVLPSTTQLIAMMTLIDQARPLEITDLLGRDEVTIDNDQVAAYLRGARVLVTGAGGSIGAELCRQIVLFEPESLVMVDRDETALQGVQLAINGHGLLDDPGLVLADIRDRDRMQEIFRLHRPSVVFHAAALKHLPLLESHPREALLTNIFGTKHLLDAAAEFGVQHFVNVSTDKAASPSSVLGTTKRLAEVLTVQTGERSSGEFLSVRFGNVLGSRGSVLPAFRKQIVNGGPVTVTHPDVTRYFMSIPEAVRLILQSGAFGTTGETLVLDMGEPMKIVELAERLIRHERADVEIVFTGLRPNEKLHEVLSSEHEVMTSGPHPRVWHTAAANHAADGLDLASLAECPAADLPDTLLALCETLRPSGTTDRASDSSLTQNC